MSEWNINWNVTKECNLRCKHCYYEAGEGLEDELTAEEALQLIDRIVETFGEGTGVTLGGGEALLREDIFDLISIGTKKGLRMSLASNGKAIDREVAVKLKEAGLADVIIPIDGVKETHDSIRGKGIFDLAVKAAKNCREAGLELVVDPCIMKCNVGELPDILDIAEGLGARQCRFFHYVAMGRGSENIPDGELNADRYAENLVEIYEEQRKREIELCTTHASQYWVILKRMEEKGLPVPDFFYDAFPGCRAGVAMLSIKPNGDVVPCPFFEVTAGNVREVSFSEILNSKVVSELRDRDRLKGRCGECIHRTLCGGCRVRAYAQTGDYMEADPMCSDFFFEKG